MIAWIALGVAVVGFVIVGWQLVRLRRLDSLTFATVLDEMAIGTDHLEATQALANQVRDLRAVVSALTQNADQADSDLRNLAAATAGIGAVRPRKPLTDVVRSGDDAALEAWLYGMNNKDTRGQTH